jgi:ferredoxin
MCPDVFELDEDGIAIALNPKGDSEEAIQDCLDACPESCIHWRD